jgi:hypothetical protein
MTTLRESVPVLAEELCKARERLKVFEQESTKALKAGAALHPGLNGVFVSPGRRFKPPPDLLALSRVWSPP